MHTTSFRQSITDSHTSFNRSVMRSRSPVRGVRQTTVIEHSPARYASTAITHSPMRAVTTTRGVGGVLASNVVTHSPAPVPIGRTEHLSDRMADALVSYGVNEFGEQVKVTSTGIISGPALRTVAEKVSPPRRHVANHIHTTVQGYPLMTSTTVADSAPVRQFKETVYSPTRNAYPTAYGVRTNYSPLRSSGIAYAEQPIMNSVGHTVTRVGHSPLRGGIATGVNPIVSRVEHSPLRGSITRVDHSPLRGSYTRVVDHSQLRGSYTRVDVSPPRESYTRVVNHSPLRSPVTRVDHRVSRIDHSPVRAPLVPVTTTVDPYVRRSAITTTFDQQAQIIDHSPLRTSGVRIDRVAPTISIRQDRVQPVMTTRTERIAPAMETVVNYSPARSRQVGMHQTVTTSRIDHSPVRSRPVGVGIHHTVATGVSRVEHSPARRMVSRSISRSNSPRRVHHHYDLRTNAAPIPAPVVERPATRSSFMHFESPSRRYSKTVVENSTVQHRRVY